MEPERKLIGGLLTGCCFCKSGYTLNLSANRKSYDMSTNYHISDSLEDVENGIDLEKHISIRLWDILEEEIVDILLSNEYYGFEIVFTNDKHIYMWSPEPPEDNIAIVREVRGKEWFPIM